MSRAEYRRAYGVEPWWPARVTEGPSERTREEYEANEAAVYWRVRAARAAKVRPPTDDDLCQQAAIADGRVS